MSFFAELTIISSTGFFKTNINGAGLGGNVITNFEQAVFEVFSQTVCLVGWLVGWLLTLSFELLKTNCDRNTLSASHFEVFEMGVQGELTLTYLVDPRIF